MSGLTTWLGVDLALDAARAVGDVVDQAVAAPLRIAVTGLRRSGKTVFTTCLIHQLLDGTDLPFLEAAHSGRLLGVKLLPPRSGDPFPFRSYRERLTANPPGWPDATTELSGVRLEIAYRTDLSLAKRIAPIRTTYVDLIDYPGEWLLDLPLMEMDFARFSADALERMNKGSRRASAEPFMRLVELLEPDGAVSAALIDAFTEHLLAVQRDLKMTVVAPGRFTNPGALEGSELLRFCPLPDHFAGSPAWRDMERRYERYKAEVVEPFYANHFSAFDRQIVLVDVLTSLNAGPEHFQDTSEALALIAKSFDYGSSSWLGRLFAPKIDTLLFAATKADHVASNQHANLKQLLERMVAPASRTARFAGVKHDVLALASLRSTDTVRTEHQGQKLSCVRGKLVGKSEETVLFPGEIPEEPPLDEEWDEERFRFLAFAPRRLVDGKKGQHIRLDQALERLIGDRLR